MSKPNFNQIEDLVEFINEVKTIKGLGYLIDINRLNPYIEINSSTGEKLFYGCIRDCYYYLKGYFTTLIKFI